MRVRAWSNGASRRSGAGYGLKVSTADRDKAFDEEWTHVVLTIPGQGEIVVSLSASFWRICSELRSAAIGRWLLETGRAPWPRGVPPSLRLTHTGGNRFSVDSAGEG
jgi:hypothetical protein